jgi:hypothetical protein
MNEESALENLQKITRETKVQKIIERERVQKLEEKNTWYKFLNVRKEKGLK